MSHKQWFLGAVTCLLAAVTFASCAAWAAREVPPVLDAAGLSKEQATEASLREQYEIVAERYREFNDFVSLTQSEFYAGEWFDTRRTNAQMTMRGNQRTSALDGQATAANSYYLRRSFRLEGVDNAETKLDGIREYWERQGWRTTKVDSSVYPGQFHVTADTPDGTYMSLHMLGGGINLTAFSGVYWGNTDALSVAIWNIQVTELNEGSEWRPQKINADGYSLIRPGEYPPFPAWNDVGYEERLEKPQARAQPQPE